MWYIVLCWAENMDPYVILTCRTQEQKSSVASGKETLQLLLGKRKRLSLINISLCVHHNP